MEGGHQPFANEDGSIWAAQNGELFNHDDVRRELRDRGHCFASRCDTEILPHLYESVGTAFAERLRGMFGIVLWDRARRRTVLVRDRLGIKPLYYAVVGDLLVFASELKSLLASGLIGDELDHEAIDAYLTFGFFPSPATPLRQVRKLEPGHRLIVDPDGYRIERYWSYPQPSDDPISRDPREMTEALFDELDEAVRLRLMSDVPLGAMLSGGLDSSLIVAMMARHSSTPVQTFAVGFRGEGAINELADARRVASWVGAEHHEMEIGLDEAPVDLAELTWHMDEPIADLSALGFIALCELAARHVTVALSGQGADELLGGYRKHRAAAIADAWSTLPGPLGSARHGALAHGPEQMRRPAQTLATRRSRRAPPGDERQHEPGAARGLVRGDLADARRGRGVPRARARPRRSGREGAPDHALSRRQARPCGRHAPLLRPRVHGALARGEGPVPRPPPRRVLRAHPPVDEGAPRLGDQVPAQARRARLGARRDHRQAQDRVLQPGRLGAGSGRRSSGAVQEYLLDDGARYADILDRGEVTRLVSAHAAGRDPGAAPTLLSILMLEVWLRTYLPRARAAAPGPAFARS